MSNILSSTSSSIYSGANNNNKRLVRLSNGNLVTAVFDQTTTLKMYLSTDNGITWTLITGPTISAVATLKGPSMVVDSLDRIHFGYGRAAAYYVIGTPNAAGTAFTWGTTYAATGSGITSGIDLDVTENGGGNVTAHMVYSIKGATAYVYYARFDVDAAGNTPGDVANKAMVATFATSASCEPAPFIKADSAKNLHVVYTTSYTSSAYQGSQYVKATFNGTTWAWGAQESMMGTALNAEYATNVAFGADGTVYAPVKIYSPTASKVYKRTPDGVWSEFYNIGDSTSLGWAAVDPQGQIWVTDGVNSPVLSRFHTINPDGTAIVHRYNTTVQANKYGALLYVPPFDKYDAPVWYTLSHYTNGTSYYLFFQAIQQANVIHADSGVAQYGYQHSAPIIRKGDTLWSTFNFSGGTGRATSGVYVRYSADGGATWKDPVSGGDLTSWLASFSTLHLGTDGAIYVMGSVGVPNSGSENRWARGEVGADGISLTWGPWVKCSTNSLYNYGRGGNIVTTNEVDSVKVHVMSRWGTDDGAGVVHTYGDYYRFKLAKADKTVTTEVTAYNLATQATSGGAFAMQIRADAAKNLYVLYEMYSSTGDNGIYFAKVLYDGATWPSTWTFVEITGTTAANLPYSDASPNPQMALATDGTTYVAMKTNYDLYLTKRAPDGTWSYEIVEGTQVVSLTSVALRNDLPVVVYGTQDTTSNNAITGLWYKEKIADGTWTSATRLQSHVIGAAAYNQTTLYSPGIGLAPTIASNLDMVISYYYGNGSSAYTVSYVGIEYDAAPNAPTHTRISSTGATYNIRPTLYFTVSDPDTGDAIADANVQLSTVNDFSTLVYDGAKAGGAITGLPASSGAVVTLQLPSSWGSLSPGVYYARARVQDSKAGRWGSWSATQSFTVAAVPWGDVIPTDATGFKVAWMNDLATAINNVRQFRGLAAATFVDGTITANMDMRGAHITERRRFLADALAQVGITATWTDADTYGGIPYMNERNKLADEGGGADTDWTKWDHYASVYWTGAAVYADAVYGNVFRAVANGTSPNTGGPLYDYYPYSFVNGQKYLTGFYMRLNPGETATVSMRSILQGGPTQHSVSAEVNRTVTLTDQWQYVEFENTATETNASGGVLVWTGAPANVTLHVAKPILKHNPDRKGVHISELRSYAVRV